MSDQPATDPGIENPKVRQDIEEAFAIYFESIYEKGTTENDRRELWRTFNAGIRASFHLLTKAHLASPDTVTDFSKAMLREAFAAMRNP
jgi:hypothetical protein